MERIDLTNIFNGLSTSQLEAGGSTVNQNRKLFEALVKHVDDPSNGGVLEKKFDLSMYPVRNETALRSQSVASGLMYLIGEIDPMDLNDGKNISRQVAISYIKPYGFRKIFMAAGFCNVIKDNDLNSADEKLVKEVDLFKNFYQNHRLVDSFWIGKYEILQNPQRLVNQIFSNYTKIAPLDRNKSYAQDLSVILGRNNIYFRN